MKRSNKKLKKAFPFGRIIPITTMEQLKPGDVAVLIDTAPGGGPLFWIDAGGNVFTDIGCGEIYTDIDHNRWLDGHEYKEGRIKLLATGVMDEVSIKHWNVIYKAKQDTRFVKMWKRDNGCK